MLKANSSTWSALSYSPFPGIKILPILSKSIANYYSFGKCFLLIVSVGDLHHLKLFFSLVLFIWHLIFSALNYSYFKTHHLFCQLLEGGRFISSRHTLPIVLDIVGNLNRKLKQRYFKDFMLQVQHRSIFTIIALVLEPDIWARCHSIVSHSNHEKESVARETGSQ